MPHRPGISAAHQNRKGRLSCPYTVRTTPREIVRSPDQVKNGAQFLYIARSVHQDQSLRHAPEARNRMLLRPAELNGKFPQILGECKMDARVGQRMKMAKLVAVDESRR